MPRLPAANTSPLRLGGTDLGQLHEHWKVDAREDFDTVSGHHRDREVAGRAAKHVGQDHHTVASVDLIDQGADFGTAVFHIVVRANAHSADVPLHANDMLHG